MTQLINEATPRLRRPPAAALDYWRAALGSMRKRDVTTVAIARHRDLLFGSPTRSHGHKKTKLRSASTVRSYLATLSAVFRVGVRELRWCESNPVRDVTLPIPAGGRARFLSDNERKALLTACRQSESAALFAIVLLALTTGARSGELYALRWNDVDLARRWAIFPKTKNGTARGVPLVASVVVELEQLPRIDERVFPEVMTRAWRTAMRRAGLVDFRFHDLRHSAASHLVQSGVQLLTIATLLGHKDIRMTQRYAHVHSAYMLDVVERAMVGLADAPGLGRWLFQCLLQLEALLYRGELPRGDAAAIVGTGERQTRRVVSALLEKGVLTSESTRAHLRLAFPATLASRWMPALFPERRG